MPTYNVELNSYPDPQPKVFSLMLRITENRKHARIKLDYDISKKHFNPKASEYKYIRQSHPKHRVINEHIDLKIQEAKEAAKNLNQEGKQVTAQAIKERMLKPKSFSFIVFSESIIKEMETTGHIGNARKYKAILEKIKNYKEKKDILFQEIDHSFLIGFQTYLEELGNNMNTINGNFRTIRALYYRAIEKGIVSQSQNPFFTYRLRSGKVHKVRLTIEEIDAIEKIDVKKGSLTWNVRNAFLFSFYCAGIRVSDILLLKWKNIKNGRLDYKMQKTKMDHSVKLWDKPIAILENYRENEAPEHFIFPFFDSSLDYSDPTFLHNQISAKTALINKYLKKIAELSKINKKITTHTARHSFADIARQKTNNLYNLSKTLGHSSLKITEAYLASFDEKAVDDTMDEIFSTS